MSQILPLLSIIHPLYPETPVSSTQLLYPNSSYPHYTQPPFHSSQHPSFLPIYPTSTPSTQLLSPPYPTSIPNFHSLYTQLPSPLYSINFCLLYIQIPPLYPTPVLSKFHPLYPTSIKFHTHYFINCALFIYCMSCRNYWIKSHWKRRVC